MKFILQAKPWTNCIQFEKHYYIYIVQIIHSDMTEGIRWKLFNYPPIPHLDFEHNKILPFIFPFKAWRGNENEKIGCKITNGLYLMMSRFTFKCVWKKLLWILKEFWANEGYYLLLSTSTFRVDQLNSIQNIEYVNSSDQIEWPRRFPSYYI